MSVANVIFGTSLVTNPFQSDVNANNNRITNLADGISLTDAATLGQVGAGFMENPAIEDLSMSGLKIVQLADATDPSGATTLNQLSNWSTFPAVSSLSNLSNLNFQNGAAINGSGIGGQGGVSANFNQLTVTAQDTSSGTFPAISICDSAGVIQFYQTVKFNQAGGPLPQSRGFLQVSSGAQGPNNYAYTINGTSGKFTVGNSATLNMEELSGNQNQSVDSMMTRWSTNNMMTAGGVNSSLQNMNFISKIIDICANTMYYSVVRSLDNSSAVIGSLQRNDWIGSKGELICNDGNYYCLSQRVNQNLNRRLFCENSWTIHVRHTLGQYPRSEFRYLFTLTDISARASANTNRVTLFYTGGNRVAMEVEQNTAAPVEATTQTSPASSFVSTWTPSNIYNYFLRYNATTGIFTINIHDNNGNVIGVNTGADISNVSTTVPVILSQTSWNPRFLYIGYSPFSADLNQRGIFYNVNIFEKELNENERTAVCVASRDYYDNPNQNVSLKNIQSIQKNYRPITTTGTINLTNAARDGNILFSGGASTIQLNSNTTSGISNNTSTFRGREWDVINTGGAALTLAAADGIVIVGDSNIRGQTKAKLIQTDISNFFIENPVQTTAQNANYVFQNASISGVSVLTCTDLVINGAAAGNPAIVIQTGNGTNSMRTITPAGNQQLTEWVWTQEAPNNTNISWLGTSFQNTGSTNQNRGTFFAGSTGSTVNGSFGNVLFARNGNDWVNVANDAVILGGTGRFVCVARADNTASAPNVHIDASGRILRSTAVGAGSPSFYAFFRTSSYVQSLTTTQAQLAFTPQTTDACGGAFAYSLSTIENLLAPRNALINVNMSVSTPSANSFIMLIRVGASDVAQQIIDTSSEIRNISCTAMTQLVVGSSISIRALVGTNTTVTIHNVQWTVTEIR